MFTEAYLIRVRISKSSKQHQVVENWTKRQRATSHQGLPLQLQSIIYGHTAGSAQPNLKFLLHRQSTLTFQINVPVRLLHFEKKP